MGTSKLLERINNTPISAVEMESYLQAMENDSGEPGFERSVLIARQVFGKDSDKCYSINLRMTALSELLQSESLPGWVAPDTTNGSFQVAANLYLAAGSEPLVEEGKNWRFDTVSLLHKAFQIGKTD